jgi:hypothetical protein
LSSRWKLWPNANAELIATVTGGEAFDLTTLLERALTEPSSLIIANMQLVDQEMLSRLRRESPTKSIFLYE